MTMIAYAFLQFRRLTAAGRKELEQWLSAPFVRRGGYRDDFFLKLFAASLLGRDALGEVTRVQREAYLGELKSLAELRTEHAQDPLVRLLVEAARLHTEANLRVVELAEAASGDPDGAATSEPTPAEELPALYRALRQWLRTRQRVWRTLLWQRANVCRWRLRERL